MKNLEQIGNWIKENKVIIWLYDQEFYFTQGRGKIQEYLAFFSYITIITGGLKLLLGIEINPTAVMIFIPVIVLVLTVFGWLMVKLNLYHVDMMRSQLKSPITREMYNAAKKINNKCINISLRKINRGIK